MTVGDAIGEAVGAVVVDVRVILERSIRVQNDRAMSRACHWRDAVGGVAIGIDDGQRIAFRIAVLASRAGSHIAGDDQVLGRGEAVVDGDGRQIGIEDHRVGIGQALGAEVHCVEKVALGRATGGRDGGEGQAHGMARCGAEVFAVGSPGRCSIRIILVQQRDVVG